MSSAEGEAPAAPQHTHISELLRDLGYRNADLLFNDRLVFVEGPSDREILPILLSKSGMVTPNELATTGFPSMEGGGRAKARKLQTSVLHYEQLLEELGRAALPRLYLFDGDMSDQDQTLLRKTTPRRGQEPVSLRFLPVAEIEDYLLVSEAVFAAVKEELADDPQRGPASEDEIKAMLKNASAANPGEKASAILEDIYAQFGLAYRKTESGPLIARHLSANIQPKLTELASIFKGFVSSRK